ncbi:hypothetical protein EKK58_10250, partial [Candidatus Dependentiae bacterium]
MTDSNRTQITYIKESVYGVTPNTPQMQELRITGESLNKNINNKVSAEIRADRQVTDLVQTSKTATGDINFELSYGTFDDFLQSALFSTDWSTPLAVSGTDIAADATGLTSSSTNFVAAGIQVGQMIKVDGFTGNTANNRIYRVTSVSNNDLNLSPAPAAVDAAGETVTIKGSYIRNGVTKNSFTVEKGFLEISEYFKYIGMIVNTMSLTIKSEEILTGSFGLIGKDASLSGSSLDATPTAATTTEVLNAVDDVASIREAGTEVTSPNYVEELTIELNNNLRSRFAVGSDALTSIGTGKCDITGSLKTYFGDSSLMDKFIAGSKTSIDFTVKDAAGNAYLIDLPEVKFDSANVVAQGQDQDVFAEMNYRAIRDAVYGFTIQVCKFP